VTNVVLIRHAETAWNLDRRWQGHADVPLTAEGEAQAAMIGNRIAALSLGIEALYTSDLARAFETARRIGAALELTPVADAIWREMNLGCWSGLRKDEIALRHAEEWARIAGGEDLPRGGGETLAVLAARVQRGLAGLSQRHPDALVAVVSHGGLIRVARVLALGLPLDRLRDVEAAANGCAYELVGHGTHWVTGRELLAGTVASAVAA
jgi:probable phosphoglycerate mutase